MVIVLAIIDIATDTFNIEEGSGLLTGLFAIATLLPSISVGVRRLHDMGKSGWWSLVLLVPFVGVIIMLIMCAQPGESGSNQYGSDPKAVT